MTFSSISKSKYPSALVFWGMTICFLWKGLFAPAFAQETQQDQPKTIMGTNVTDTLRSDTTKIVEDAPLDIAQNRGLFIVTPDQKMQLRILGSVRYLVVFDNRELSSKNNLNTYEVPTGSLNQLLPSYFNGLEQTRLGFEVTRKTEKGNIFIRLETDFAGPDGFRFRHAYGQYKRFLFGQTWSLFSQLNAQPATVDFSGPTGSIILRTPQIRYTFPRFIYGTNLAVGLEYGNPDLKIPDSVYVKTFQLIPDITARIDKSYSWGSLQLSGILPVLSGRGADGDLIFRPGWGLAVSTVINSWANGTWYLQGVAGEAITRFFSDLSGNGLDILFNPDGGAAAPISFGYYGTYQHSWRTNLYSSLTYGMVILEKITFSPENIYHWGHTFRFNTFWDIAEGSKIGAEVIRGRRTDKDRDRGEATRINLLFYYDF
jgi:hypothetical protein